MAELALAAAGSYLGSAAISGTVMGMSGAAIGWAAGSLLGGVLFPPKMPNGPRLDDLTVQVSTYGRTIPRLWGTMRMAGNVIWASNLTERKSEQGGKGGSSYTTYNYSCSFAVALCEGVIEGVSRIWADGKLIYDIRPVNTSTQQGFKADGFVVYTGTETQDIDPTIQALMTDAPAYRGLAYAVFTELRLEKFGNRIPNLTFEVVKNGVRALEDPHQFGPSYVLGEDSTAFEVGYTTDGVLWFANGGRKTVEPWDVATETSLGTRLIPDETHTDSFGNVTTRATGYGNGMAYQNTFFLGRGAPGNTRLVVGAPSCGSPTITCGLPQPYTHGRAYSRAGSIEYKDRISSGQFQNAFYWPGTAMIEFDTSGNGYLYWASENGAQNSLAMKFNLGGGVPGQPAKCFCDPEFPPDTLTEPHTFLSDWALASYWAETYGTVVFQYQGTGGMLMQATGNALTGVVQSFSVVLPQSQVIPPASCYDPVRDVVWTWSGSDFNILYRNDTVTTISAPTPHAFSEAVLGCCIDTATGMMRIIQSSTIPGFPSFLSLINPDTGDVIETLELGVPLNLVQNPGFMWDMPTRRAVLVADRYAAWIVPYGPTLDPRPVLLSEVVTDLSVDAGLTPADINVAELTDEVLGYTITRQASTRASLEQLMIAYMFDAVESEGKVKFVKRGKPPVRDLQVDDLAVHEYGQARPTPLMLRRGDEAELPKVIGVRYIDRANDYQTAVQEARRQSGRAEAETSIEAPVVLTTEHAKALADTALYTAWVGRTKCEWSTTLEHADVEPTDVVRISGNVIHVSYKARDGNILRWRGEFDSGVQLIAGAVSGTPYVWVPGAGIVELPLSELLLMDIPLISDVDNYVGVYYGASAHDQEAAWPGAILYQGAPGGGAANSPVRLIEFPATWGGTINALPDVGDYNMVDERYALKINLVRGALASAAYADVLNGANLLLVGDEILQFRQVTSELDGTLTLTGLLRGRKGTPTSGHFAGQRVVLLDPAVRRLPLAEGDIGVLRNYRAVTSGASVESAPNVFHSHAGVAQRPLRLVQVAAGRDAAGTLRFKWVRRARYDSEWRDGVDVALGEAVESYRVDIYEDATYAVVVRSITVTGQQHADYSAADQTTDFGGPQPEVFARLWQISAVVGAGFDADITA